MDEPLPQLQDVATTQLHVRRLDDKFRVQLPPDFRELVGTRVRLIAYDGGCIAAFKEADIQPWIGEVLARTARTDADLNLQRKVAMSVALTMDSQSRVGLPRALRDSAAIEPAADVVVLHAGARAEIWSHSRYFGAVDSTSIRDAMARSGMFESDEE